MSVPDLDHHSDAGVLTVLQQDDIGGLQVYRDGRWYPVQPEPTRYDLVDWSEFRADSISTG